MSQLDTFWALEKLIVSIWALDLGRKAADFFVPRQFLIKRFFFIYEIMGLLAKNISIFKVTI